MSAMFQDTMDSSRVVKPLHQKGKVMICDIYWWDGLTLGYGGKAPIPGSLFDNTVPWNRFIGFVPFNSNQP